MNATSDQFPAQPHHEILADINKAIELMEFHLLMNDAEPVTAGLTPDTDASSEVETVYPVDPDQNPVDGIADLAYVSYHGLEPLHEHADPTGETEEYEVHMITETTAGQKVPYIIDGVAHLLGKGDHIVIPPRTLHFTLADADSPFTAAVMSLPNFGEDRLHEIPADANVSALSVTNQQTATLYRQVQDHLSQTA